MNQIANKKTLRAAQRVSIEGGVRLHGEVTLGAAKNSILRLMVATLLTSERCIIGPFPDQMLDVLTLQDMLAALGKRISRQGGEIQIEEDSHVTELKWPGRSIRSTILIASTLLARFGRAVVPNPGGCAIGDESGGERKIDLHLMIFEKMGATWREEGDLLIVEAPGRLKGAEIFLPIRSTGATESGILAGVLAHGETTIWGPHVRPEILDLIAMLRTMGATIDVYGQERIVVQGCESLRGTTYRCISDNVEAISWAVAAAVTGGDIEIRNFPIQDLEIPLIFLRESGVRMFVDGNDLIVRHSNCQPIDISTGPYPGINSDMQPLFAVLGLFARGESRIVDLRFRGRYQYAAQFEKMGGDISIDGNMLRIIGGKPLNGTEVVATDLRAGIGLLIAGLGANGTTTLSEAWQVERGYDRVWEKVNALGGMVRVSEYANI